MSASFKSTPRHGESDRHTSGLTEDSLIWPQALAAHRQWLRAVVYARLEDEHAVDEVLQEVALAAVKQPQLPTDSTQLSAWLYRVAVRQALLYRRQAGREKRKQERFANAIAANGAQCNVRDEPLSWLLAREEAQWVRQALLRLSRSDRELLILRYGEDWSASQMAARFNVQPNTVRIRLHRARMRLRAELNRRSHEGHEE